MFYNLNAQDKALVNEYLQRTKQKLEVLKDLHKPVKKAHLNECVKSLEACLKGEDVDKYDFFIYDIYSIFWDKIRKEQVEADCPSLKELAKTLIKDEVNALIDNSEQMQERLKLYTENGTPRNISIRQAKLALLDMGLLDEVEAMVKNADKATQISWEYATEFDRDNALILKFQQELKLSDAQVDELFKKAKNL